jgi:putative cardiolipin synthase
MRNLIFILAVLVAFGTSATELSKSIPYPFHSEQSGGVNAMMFLDDGMMALAQRLAMIRRAKRTIEVEYFIYNTDTAARIFTKELVSAAKRGVKIRVLIDKSLPIFVFDKRYARELAVYGIDVRYYNTAAIWQLSTEQFRNHRKLLSVDDTEAITGGRNIADEYFDLNHDFNFEDSDLYVRGPLSKVMRESFDLFFANHMTKRPKLPTERAAEVRLFLESTTADEREARVRLADAEAALAQKVSYDCPTATFSTDAPGANLGERLKSGFVDRFRFLRKTLYDKVASVDRGIVISSPYIIDGEAIDEMMGLLKSRHAKIDVYTNSLGSTDAYYVAANMYLNIKSWRRAGVKVVLHDGRFIEKSVPVPEFVRRAKSGTHSKVQIYQTSTGNEVMVGTYNVDHRSSYYNAEMALFCKGSDGLNAEIAKSVSNDIDHGLKVSADATYVIDGDGHRKSIYAASKMQILKMKLMTLISRIARELL